MQTTDGGYAVAGETYSFGAGGNDVYMIKTNANGDTLWTKTYGGSNADFGRSIQITFDGGFIMGGGTASFGSGKLDAYAVRTSSNGDTLWTNTFGGAEDDFANAIIQTLDTGYAFIGTTESYGAGAKDGYFLKMNKNGSFSWFQTYLGNVNDEGKDLIQLTNGNFVLLGYTENTGLPPNFIFYITDKDGWSFIGLGFGSISYDDFGYSIIARKKGGFALFGTTNGYGVGLTDFYLITTDSNGHDFSGNIYANFAPGVAFEDTNIAVIVSSDKLLILNNTQIIIYPNPVIQAVTIELFTPLINYNFNGLNFALYNLFGQKVKEINNHGSKKLTFNRSDLLDGIYFYRIVVTQKDVSNQNGEIFSGKITLVSE